MTMEPGRCDDVPAGTRKRVGCRSVGSTTRVMRSEEAEGGQSKAGGQRQAQAGQSRRTVGGMASSAAHVATLRLRRTARRAAEVGQAGGRCVGAARGNRVCEGGWWWWWW
jgi:hypothetical protein